jgi:hypothetical protein
MRDGFSPDIETRLYYTYIKISCVDNNNPKKIYRYEFAEEN